MIRYKFVFIALLSILAASCGKKEGDTKEDPASLVVKPTVLNFESRSQMGNIEVLANRDWTANSDAAWLTINPTQGSGNGNITIKLTANVESQTREGNITVTVAGVEPKVIKVAQLGEAADIRIAPTSGSISSLGGELKFVVTANIEWVVEVPQNDQSWISVVPPTRAMVSADCTLKIEQNSSTPRSSIIKIKSTDGKISVEYRISQDEYSGVLSLSQHRLVIPAKIASVDFAINSDAEYEIVTVADWISLDKSASTSIKAVLKFAPNISDEPRYADVVLKQSIGSKQERLTVMQYGMPDMRIGDDITVGALAFPGADGAGRLTTGGRGGDVYFVTSLADTDTGSGNTGTLRWCLARSGNRTIIFNVSGRIVLKSRLNISNGNVTIAGQTAPGDGICISDNQSVIQADNVVMRFIRFRMGDEGKDKDKDGNLVPVESDAIWGRNQMDIILDHCSMSWSTDECSSFYDNETFTMQWCNIIESLNVSVHTKGAHGYGGIWGGKGVSFHHNLLGSHKSRNPRMCGSRYSNRPDLELVDFRNNVIFNWGSNSGYAGEGGNYNFINNYYRPGPATGSDGRARIFQPYPDNGENSQPKDVWGIFYLTGNYMTNTDGTPNAIINSNNLVGLTPYETSKDKSELISVTQFSVAPVRTHTAIDAFERVRNYVGASLVRDAVDIRYMDYVGRSGTITFPYTGKVGSVGGLIDTQGDVGGWPTYKQLPAWPDTDGDGIPDIWEDSYGSNKNDKSDGNSYSLDPAGRYTNLEVYLHNLVQHIVKGQSIGSSF